MYRMFRVFCATAWDLDKELRAFHDAISEVNGEGMQQQILFVPVSLMTMRDKRPFHGLIVENIEDSSYYILAPGDDWGPPERNFQRDYALALECRDNPALPMRDVV